MEFTKDFENMCKDLQIRHHTTLPFHPMGNGMAEAFVKTTK